jgi:arylformamidase
VNAIDYEAEYNNRAKVPEHPAILAGWQAAAAAFRAAHAQAELDVPYGPSARQRLDLFWPDGGRDAPLALFIHGGYWQGLDKSWGSHLAAGLVAHGIAVAMPSYDLCPQVPVTTIVAQMRDAVAMLAARHARAMYAMGHSAGGHLAAMLLATDWPARGLPPGQVNGATTFSGLFDLEALVGTSINIKLGLDAAEARRLSPINLPRPAGRIAALVGALEGAEYARQSQAIAAAWDGTASLVEGRHHFDIVAPLADPASAMIKAIAATVHALTGRA